AADGEALELPAAVLRARLRRRADRPGGRADRGRRPRRRRGPGRPGLRDSPRPAARGALGDGRTAWRGAGRRTREGQAARLASPLGRGRRPAGTAPSVRRAPAHGPAPLVRPGPRRVRLRPHAPGRAADPAAAADAEPRQLDLLAL